MKKLLLSITLLLCSIIGFAGFAGNAIELNKENGPNGNTIIEFDLLAEANIVNGTLFSGGVLSVSTGSVSNNTDTSAMCSGVVTDVELNPFREGEVRNNV